MYINNKNTAAVLVYLPTPKDIQKEVTLTLLRFFIMNVGSIYSTSTYLPTLAWSFWLYITHNVVPWLPFPFKELNQMHFLLSHT